MIRVGDSSVSARAIFGKAPVDALATTNPPESEEKEFATNCLRWSLSTCSRDSDDAESFFRNKLIDRSLFGFFVDNNNKAVRVAFPEQIGMIALRPVLIALGK